MTGKEAMKLCRICGRKKHPGLCDMAELDNGQIVHASRIVDGKVDGVRVRNKWRKDLSLGEKKNDGTS